MAHPGSTLGYRLEEGGRVLTYIPDHEPALGHDAYPEDPTWVSGYTLSREADMLVHDAQYTDEEYADRVGWGHTSISQLAKFVEMAEVRRLVTFHHDPSHTDAMLDDLHDHLEGLVEKTEIVAGTPSVLEEV